MNLTRASCLAALLPVLVCHAAEDPVVAQRGTDRLTLSQARTLAGQLDPAARQRLANPQAVTELLRNTLLQRAVLAQAQAAKWDRRPDVVALAQRARDLAVGQSFLAAQAPVPAGYPSEADIAAAYQDAKPRLMQPRAYHLSQVFLACAPKDAEASRARLAVIARQSMPAGGLAEAAGHASGAAYSDLGWLAENQIVPDIRTVVSGLQEGATSAPVCTQAGCHLIHLIATRPAGPAPLDAVRDGIVRALRQAKQAAVEQAYVDALLARQPVQVNERAAARIAAP
jgi:peptidylprolyl isomerase